jgi:uncharacterized protein YeaO (DUF488 family)
MKSEKIRIKRVYDPPSPEDGQRVLVDRLWPRGTRRNALSLDGWMKAVAPSPELRRWFHQHPDQWEVFIQRYREELDAHPENWKPLLDWVREGRVTLLFASRDRDRNHAKVFQAYLLERLSKEKERR